MAKKEFIPRVRLSAGYLANLLGGLPPDTPVMIDLKDEDNFVHVCRVDVQCGGFADKDERYWLAKVILEPDGQYDDEDEESDG